jgi:hypothetical protein
LDNKAKEGVREAFGFETARVLYKIFDSAEENRKESNTEYG